MQLKMPAKPRRINEGEIRNALQKELKFINEIFSILPIPTRVFDENDDDYLLSEKSEKENPQETREVKRAANISELRLRLEKIKGERNHSVKNKLLKKSLTSKAKKAERKLKAKLLKTKNRPPKVPSVKAEKEVANKEGVNQVKPVFNSQGKLVFSKFDFSGTGQKGEKKKKGEKDPQKILENLKKQDETVKKLQESGEVEKAIEMKEKIAWRNALAKAEGDKVKDDPLLLKKSIKNQEQRKKQSKRRWDERIQNVEQKKDDRQKKRQENISKKKKEKASKKIKRSAKKGRIVL